MWKQSFPETLGSADWTELTHEEDTQLQTALKELEQN